MSGAIVTSTGDHHRGFHQCPNVLRDKYMPLVGGDGYGYINYLMSWANTNATLSIRRMKRDLDWSQDKLERVQRLVLDHCGHFISVTPGDRVTANRWHLDMERVWAENAIHLAQRYTDRLAGRGVPEIGTPQKETRGGVPEIGTGGAPEVGTPGVPEIGTYKDIPLKTSRKTSGVLDVVGDAREANAVAQPSAAPVVGLSTDPRTTFSASPSTDEAMPVTPALGTPITSPAVVSSVTVLEPPVGGAADAAQGEDAILLEEFEGLLGRRNDQVTDIEKIPGGGAAGAAPMEEAPRGALLPPTPLGVAHLVPVPRDELLSRPVAPLDSLHMRMIRSLVTGKLLREGLLDQLTPTGGLPREDWLRLTLDELEQVKWAAQADAQARIGGMTSQAIDGLDRLIGGGKKAKGSKGSGGSPDPAAIARYDPYLAVGQRCEVDGGTLGVVFEVTNAHYLVDLDDGERLSIDRALKVQLQRLRASDAPAPAPRKVSGPVVLADVGSQWQPKSGGDVVTVQRVEGSQRGLCNGATLAVFNLVAKFERVGA